VDLAVTKDLICNSIPSDDVAAGLTLVAGTKKIRKEKYRNKLISK